MTILVTGGAGYIGSHMILELLDYGQEVIVLDNLSTGCKEAIHGDAQFVRGDISDARIIDKICRTSEICSVFHFAGSTSVPESVSNPLRYYQNNVEGSRSLVENLQRNNVKNLVFSSTAAVYGMCGSAPVSETSPCQPTSPYGWSKYFAEQILHDVSQAHGINVAVLRYFNVAGADPDGRLGQLTPNAGSLIKSACEVAVGKRDVLKVFGQDYDTPDGTCIRDFIHVSDLACAHRLALDYLQTENMNVLCNLGYGIGNSVSEIVRAVGKAAGKTLPIRHMPRRPGDLEMVISQSDRAKSILGWTPVYDDIDYIVKTAFDWENSIAR